MNTRTVSAGRSLYLAGPLFCEARQRWHRETKALLGKAGYRVVWPFELFDQGEIAAWGDTAARRVMTACRDALTACDLVVALLDGSQVDDGTAWEVGYAHAWGIPVVGIRTDFRAAGDVPGARVNAMIHASCLAIVNDSRDLPRAVAAALAGAGPSRPPRG